MRKLLLTLLLALPLASLAAETKVLTLDVQNMTCDLCTVTVKKALEKVAGVSLVKVDYEKKTATVTFDSEKTRAEILTAATANAGFPSVARK